MTPYHAALARPKIREGDSGPPIKTLQERLGVTVDGMFGETTDAAVKLFQLKNGLTIDGVVGPITWNALFQEETL